MPTNTHNNVLHLARLLVMTSVLLPVSSNASATDELHQSTTSVLSFYDGGFSRDAHRPVDLSLKVVANGSASRTPEFKMQSTVEYGLLRGMMESLP